jgi:hypothetical protein
MVPRLFIMLINFCVIWRRDFPFELYVGFEPTIPASARPQTYALDRVATGVATALLFSHLTL